MRSLGPKCLETLRGMFALGLWDSRKQQLILARDRIGIKPLHYGLFGDGIAFASELSSIRAAADGDLAIEYTAIADVFTYSHIPSPKTIYRDVYSLEPGHYLVVDRGGVVKHRYWDLEGEPVELGSETGLRRPALRPPEGLCARPSGERRSRWSIPQRRTGFQRCRGNDEPTDGRRRQHLLDRVRRGAV